MFSEEFWGEYLDGFFGSHVPKLCAEEEEFWGEYLDGCLFNTLVLPWRGDL